ncbi:AAA family ATPase [Acidisphaera sp. L21]|uniref:AAA family ATPase n=1 Tax=Acidisphaera sp. L21 TaxID=1641851 RepID=UPI00131D7322|nr:AAA family ATPase [Acidisphaera sp. L21]
MFLDRIVRRPGHVGEGFPWTVPLIAGLQDLRLTTAVTFLVGENGCGKSTLLEGLAWGMAATAIGSHGLERDPTLNSARRFDDGFRFIRTAKAYTRLFLRAEDVFGFTTRVTRDMAVLQAEAKDLGRVVPPGIGRTRAVGLARGQASLLAQTYGADPDARSHGETFLHLLQARLAPDGLYFLDEPETPLSPTRILALIIMIEDLVASGCQFVIATHSPILLALPGATILCADHGQLAPAEWDDLEHVRVTRAFLTDPASVLKRLRD